MSITIYDHAGQPYEADLVDGDKYRALESELAALRRDKARLDWLENVAFKLHYGNCDKYEHHDYVAHIHSGGTYYSGKVLPLRAAIDAAQAQEEKL